MNSIFRLILAMLMLINGACAEILVWGGDREKEILATKPASCASSREISVIAFSQSYWGEGDRSRPADWRPVDKEGTERLAERLRGSSCFSQVDLFVLKKDDVDRAVDPSSQIQSIVDLNRSKRFLVVKFENHMRGMHDSYFVTLGGIISMLSFTIIPFYIPINYELSIQTIGHNFPAAPAANYQTHSGAFGWLPFLLLPSAKTGQSMNNDNPALLAAFHAAVIEAVAQSNADAQFVR